MARLLFIHSLELFLSPVISYFGSLGNFQKDKKDIKKLNIATHYIKNMRNYFSWVGLLEGFCP